MAYSVPIKSLPFVFIKQTSEGVTVLLARVVSSLPLSDHISLASYSGSGATFVTVKAQTAAGTRDATLMATDTGL